MHFRKFAAARLESVLSSKRQVSVRIERWAMHAPFHITGHVFTVLDCVLVEIAEGACIGRGEAAGVYYLGDTPDLALEQIHALKADIEAGLDRTALQGVLPPGGARNAIDCALWDLECKRAKQTIWDKLTAERRTLTTCQTIGVLPTPDDTAKAAIALAGYKLIKLKLNADRPIERVKALRAARPDVRIIVDANQGLTMPLLQECLPEFAKCKVELVEQPLPRGEDAGLEGMERLVPLCADESCLHLGELDAAARRYDFINIKLDKTGGLTEGLLLADEAIARGLDVMVGNMLGTSLSMAPAFMVALKSRIADLDGPMALKSDRIGAMTYNRGVVSPFSSDLWG
ncbi:L-alanine-DL-glutamate epimerase [alpha proteobacterium U9-1i]|nr:L-alanine-DL-glutamate epimerase [alpha proteobacterium U9-1i]